MKTQSEEEAREILAETRADLIGRGKDIAEQLCRKNGFTHAQLVWAEMKRQRWLHNCEHLPGNWLANVFKSNATVERCGHAKIGNKERNAHAAQRAVWKLRGAPTHPAVWSLNDFVPDDSDSRPSAAELRTAIHDLRGLVGVAVNHGCGIAPETIRTMEWLKTISGAN